jgi:outer membrane immunogenic protein
MRDLKTISASAIGAALVLMTNPAYAQDGGDFYAGISLGAGWNSGDATTTVSGAGNYFANTSVTAINGIGATEVKSTPFVAGLDAGYDYHTGSIVIGLAADISLMRATGGTATTIVYPCCAPTSFTVAQKVKSRYLATVRAKLGFDVGAATVYATGGWAGMGVDYNPAFSDTYASASAVGSLSKFKSGWTAGAGADIRMGKNLSIQPEILYADFGSETVTSGALTAGTPLTTYNPVFTTTADLHTVVARVGLHYHF